MQYRVFGPFEVPRDSNRRIPRSGRERKPFWADIDESVPGLSAACGCYVFTLRDVVQYVGMTNKQNFEKECFPTHKRELYNDAMANKPGVPRLILLARMTPAGKFSKASKNVHRDLPILENLLIGLALARNQDVQNVRGTAILKELKVPGVLNRQRGEGRSKTVQALKKALGI